MIKDLEMRLLYIIHIFNDGLYSCMPILLPFISKELGITIDKVGILGSLLSILSIFIALPAGYLSNKFGSLKIIIFSMLLYGLGLLGTSFSFIFPLLAFFFFLAGIGFGLFHPIAHALITRLFQNNRVGRRLGDFAAIGDVGRILFPALMTSLTAYIGWRLNAALLAFITILVFLILYFIKGKHKHILSTNIFNKSQVKFKVIFSNPKFTLTLFAGFLDTFCSTSLFIFLPFLFLHKGIGYSFLGLFMAVYFIGNLIGRLVLSRLADKYGEGRTFIISEFFMAIFILLLTTTQSIFLIIVFGIILGIFTRGTGPLLQVRLGRTSLHHGDYEKAFGVSSTVAGISNTLAPAMLGYIAFHFGIINAFNLCALIALAAVIPFLISAKIRK